MNLGPLMPTGDNIARFRAEFAAATEAELIAQEAKDPNMAPGIAAKQLLAEVRTRREAAARKPHWTQTPGFIATVVLGTAGVILAVPAVQKRLAFELPSPMQPASPASQPSAASAPVLPSLSTTAAAPTPPAAASQSK
jgi:hypothetical protein